MSMPKQESHGKTSHTHKHRKILFIIGASLVGLALLGVSTAVYANEWKSNEHQLKNSQYQMVQAQHELDKAIKTYEANYKDLTSNDITPQGHLAVISLASNNPNNESHNSQIASISQDKPTITSTLLWTLKDEIRKTKQITEEINKEISYTNDRINTIKSELKKHEIENARKQLIDKISQATQLYNESEGRTEDNKTREDLKKWIDENKAFLNKKEVNDDLAVYSSNLSEADDLMKKVKSSEAAYDQRINSMNNEVTASSNGSKPDATVGYGNQYERTSQPNYDNQTSNQTSVTTQTQNYSNDHAVAESCNATNVGDQANTCQGAIDRGSMVDVQYFNGDTHIYSQHNRTGGAWINDLKPGDTVSFGGKQYTVNDYSQQGVTEAPSSGYYAQTCNENGNHLIGLTPKN